MKFVLIVIWVVGNGSLSSRHIEMQEFDSKQTCEVAAQHLYQHGKLYMASCLQK